MTNNRCFLLENFKSNVDGLLYSLLNNTEYTDVTLVSEDGHPINAHKVVLSFFSPFFHNLFMKTPQPHQTIFLIGAQHEILQKVIYLIYRGQVDVQNDEVEKFYDLTKHLEITESIESKAQVKSVIKTSAGISKKEIMDKKADTGNNTHEAPLAASKPVMSVSTNEVLDPKPKNIKKDKRKGSPKGYCDQCTYSTVYSHDLRKHIESVHEGRKYSCNLCSYIANYSNVEKHKYKKHYLPMLL